MDTQRFHQANKWRCLGTDCAFDEWQGESLLLRGHSQAKNLDTNQPKKLVNKRFLLEVPAC